MLFYVLHKLRLVSSYVSLHSTLYVYTRSICTCLSMIVCKPLKERLNCVLQMYITLGVATPIKK